MTSYKIQSKIIEELPLKLDAKKILIGISSAMETKEFNKLMVKAGLKFNTKIFGEALIKRILAP